MVDPEFLLGGEGRDSRVDEPDFLRAEVGGHVAGDQGEGLCGTIAAKTDVEGVLGTIGEGDYVDYVDPEIVLVKHLFKGRKSSPSNVVSSWNASHS